MRTVSLVASLLAVCSLAFAGCMDPLNDYKDCVKIEKARCDLRDSCSASFDRATCYDYYEEYCRTRKVDGPLGGDATKEQVDQCVAAIATVPCDQLDRDVDETDSLSECEFLWPKDDEDDTDSETEEDTETESDPPDAG